MKIGSVGILLGGAGVGSIAVLDEANSERETAADSTTASTAKSGMSTGTKDGGQSNTASQDESPSQQTQPAESDAAAFQVTALRAPSEVEILTEYTVEVVVKNTGGVGGTFNSELVVDPVSDVEKTVPIELSIPTGETRTSTLKTTPPSMGTASYEIGQQRTEVTAVKRTESVGTAVTSRSVRITVTSLSEEGATYRGHKPENAKFIVAEVTAKNVSDSEIHYLPNYLDFKLFDSQRTKQYEPVSLGVDFERYETANVRPGVKRSGPIVFDVSADTRIDDVVIYYHDGLFDVTIEWQQS